MPEIDWASLTEAANAARHRAYAPYSGYQVGAALLSADGQVFSGCNVENVSYGLSICAERNAIFSAVNRLDGPVSIVAMVVATRDLGTPCGACRQVMAEFAKPDTPLRMVAGVDFREYTLADLLPFPFSAAL